jgi:hypothetical protein
VVFANREYEAWFLAAAESLQGKRGFEFEKTPAFEPERLRNAKGWLGERMTGGSTARQPTNPPCPQRWT